MIPAGVVPITLVRNSADKPRPLNRISREADLIDADIVGSGLHQTLAEITTSVLLTPVWTTSAESAVQR